MNDQPDTPPMAPDDGARRTHAVPPERTLGQDWLGLRSLIEDLLRFDRRVLAILIASPILLTLLEYHGMPWHWMRRQEVSYSGSPERRISPQTDRVPPVAKLFSDVELPGSRLLRPWVWWGLACLTLLILLPLLIGRVFAGVSPRQMGLRIRGTTREAPTYLAMYLIFLPVIYLVSRTPEFQHTYPFFKGARQNGINAEFWAFEAIYCLQFLGIELFFRGFLVLGLKKRIGWAAVPAMLAPYCMIHYYKPMPEAMGAVAAGLILGTLAYRSGTIIYGWLLHFAVALSMDLLSMQQQGLL